MCIRGRNIAWIVALVCVRDTIDYRKHYRYGWGRHMLVVGRVFANQFRFNGRVGSIVIPRVIHRMALKKRVKTGMFLFFL